MRRPCLGCGRPARGTRCRGCERARQAAYGSAYRRRRAMLIGLPCALRLSGCTGTADTADHIVPRSRGGADSPLRPACAHCNASRGDRMEGGTSPSSDAGRSRPTLTLVPDPVHDPGRFS